jgi:hypothetical protein
VLVVVVVVVVVVLVGVLVLLFSCCTDICGVSHCAPPGEILSTITIHTIDGDYPIFIHGVGIPCQLNIHESFQAAAVDISNQIKNRRLRQKEKEKKRAAAGTTDITVAGHEQQEQHEQVDKLDFGAVGFGFAMEKYVTIQNTSDLPMKVFNTFKKPASSHSSSNSTSTASSASEQEHSNAYQIHPSGLVHIPPKSTQKYTITFTPTALNTTTTTTTTNLTTKVKYKKEKVNLSFRGMPEEYPFTPQPGAQNPLADGKEERARLSTFLKHNPLSKHTVHLVGTGGKVDLTISPSDVLNFGAVPSLMPREKEIQVTNIGTAAVNIAIFDQEGTMFPASGKSFSKIGMVNALPVSMYVSPGETRTFAISVTLRKSGFVAVPFHIRLLGSQVLKEWTYVVQALVEQPMINDYVMNIMDNEHLPCLVPIRLDPHRIAFEDMLRPKPTPGKDGGDLYGSELLLPVGPMVWTGPEKDIMTGYMNIPEPVLSGDVLNLQFKRQYDGRQSIRFGDSTPSKENNRRSAKKKRRRGGNNKGGRMNKSGKEEATDQLWKSLRPSSRIGLY